MYCTVWESIHSFKQEHHCTLDCFAGAHAGGRIEYEDTSSEHYCPWTPFGMSFVYLIFHWVFLLLSCFGYNWKTWNRACGVGGGGQREAHVVQSERVFTVSAVSGRGAAVLPSVHHPHPPKLAPKYHEGVQVLPRGNPPKYNDLSF